MQAKEDELHHNKCTESWVPAGIKPYNDRKFFFLNFIATIFAKYRVKTEHRDEEEKEDDKPKSIFERENIFRKPFEDKD